MKPERPYRDMRRKGNERPTSHQRGYDANWRKLRRQKLRANPLCEECERGGLVVVATMVHHILPIEEGGEVLDWDNLMSLCEICHDKKHSKNSIGNVGGCGSDGLPLHTGHPWNK